MWHECLVHAVPAERQADNELSMATERRTLGHVLRYVR